MIFSGLNNELLSRESIVAIDMKVNFEVIFINLLIRARQRPVSHWEIIQPFTILNNQLEV